MAHKYTQAEDWAQIAHGVIESVPELQSLKDAEIGYLAADYSKKYDGMTVYAECIKVKDLYKPYCPHDMQDFRRIIEKYGPGWADTRADE